MGMGAPSTGDQGLMGFTSDAPAMPEAMEPMNFGGSDPMNMTEAPAADSFAGMPAAAPMQAAADPFAGMPTGGGKAGVDARTPTRRKHPRTVKMNKLYWKTAKPLP